MSQRYAYKINYYGTDGTPIGSSPVEPDWSAALESTHFLGVRRGLLFPTTAPVAGTVVPIFDAPGERPGVRAFRAAVSPPSGGEPVCCEVPRSYLRPLVEQKAQDLVAKGRLEQGATFQYIVSAFSCGPVGTAPAQAPNSRFEVESLAEAIAMEECPMGPLVARSSTWGSVLEDDAPVFVPKHVMTETMALSAAAKDKEIGGVLIGKLRRARGAAEAFIEITAQIPAQHTESTSIKLTFTEDTWAAVRDVVELRSEQELLLGWWHSHPDFCARCPAENRARCSYARDFFSKDDVFLHRTCFPRGYQIALLLSDHGEPTVSASMYGWRRGEVAARSFFVVESLPVSANEQPHVDRLVPNA